MEGTFSGWADIVSKRTCIVFWVALVFFLILSKLCLNLRQIRDVESKVSSQCLMILA